MAINSVSFVKYFLFMSLFIMILIMFIIVCIIISIGYKNKDAIIELRSTLNELGPVLTKVNTIVDKVDNINTNIEIAMKSKKL